jgi:hypothetical protein
MLHPSPWKLSFTLLLVATAILLMGQPAKVHAGNSFGKRRQRGGNITDQPTPVLELTESEEDPVKESLLIWNYRHSEPACFPPRDPNSKCEIKLAEQLNNMPPYTISHVEKKPYLSSDPFLRIYLRCLGKLYYHDIIQGLMVIIATKKYGPTGTASCIAQRTPGHLFKNEVCFTSDGKVIRNDHEKMTA